MLNVFALLSNSIWSNLLCSLILNHIESRLLAIFSFGLGLLVPHSQLIMPKELASGATADKL